MGRRPFIWTSDKDRRLVAFYQAGADIDDIAAALGVSVTSAEHRACMLRKMLPPGTVPRLQRGRRPAAAARKPVPPRATLPTPWPETLAAALIVAEAPASPKPTASPAPAPHRPRRSGGNKRACLCCREPFASEGAHNRLCRRCRKLDVSPYAPAL